MEEMLMEVRQTNEEATALVHALVHGKKGLRPELKEWQKVFAEEVADMSDD